MRIDVFKGRDGWHWHFVSRGRITADSEAFPTKSNAVRAAKAVVRAVVKCVNARPVAFTSGAIGTTTIFTWS